jgi:hypothetical protein
MVIRQQYPMSLMTVNGDDALLMVNGVDVLLMDKGDDVLLTVNKN